jgi:phosphoribosyl-ATP pyrophosphohydrolase/phosphoribosyl-AMP cyclohydrolase
MAEKKIFPLINAENDTVSHVTGLADKYACEGMDAMYLYNFSGDEAEREELLSTARFIDKQIDIPFFIGMYIKRFEDAKKALYTGAYQVVLREALLPDEKELNEILARFDASKLAIEIDMLHDFHTAQRINDYVDQGFGTVILKHVEISPRLSAVLKECRGKIVIRDSLQRNMITQLLEMEPVFAVSTNYFEEKDIHPVLRSLKKQGIEVSLFESSMSFADFKKMDNGLIPVVVQDYRTSQVLMVAYMNEESFQKTIETGKMTYYSRSRRQLWCKGETSGHFQYVKKLMIDCDEDTILAKVRQVGAACHTGNYSCFYRELASRNYIDTNPLTVLSEDYHVICDRREHPKEGSYTNYLFDQGIDKILKKCGEEAAEIIIAAKNPDAEELKYEIADFLYHLMVLMVECDLDWEDVVRELVNRR